MKGGRHDSDLQHWTRPVSAEGQPRFLSDRLRTPNVTEALLAGVYRSEATELDDAARIAHDHGRPALAEVIDNFAAYLRDKADELGGTQ